MWRACTRASSLRCTSNVERRFRTLSSSPPLLPRSPSPSARLRFRPGVLALCACARHPFRAACTRTRDVRQGAAKEELFNVEDEGRA